MSPNATVFEAIGHMVEHGVGSLVVMDEGEALGILTERDYLREVALKGRSSKTTPVADIMSRTLVHVSPDTPDEDCMALMTQKRIRHLPIMEDGTLVGIVSMGDIVRYLAQERGATIDELTMYIQNAPAAASSRPPASSESKHPSPAQRTAAYTAPPK